MRIIDRYVAKSVIATFLSCIFLFLFLYVVIDVLGHLEDMLKQKINLNLLTRYYLNYMPVMFSQVSPFACLLSILFVFGRLNHNNEIIAMRASGVSIFGITRSALVCGAVISLFAFWLSDKVIPPAIALTEQLRIQMDEGAKRLKEKRPEIINNLCIYGQYNRLFFINKFSTVASSMDGVVILEHDTHQNLTKKIVANKGLFKDGLWRFYQSITYSFDLNGQVLDEPRYLEEEIMDIPERPEEFVKQRQRSEYMTVAQLNDYMRKLARSGAKSVIRNLKVDLYQRRAAPWTNLVIVVLGIPFAMMLRKRGSGLSSVGVAIMVGFLYFVLDAIMLALGKGGALPPMAAAWASHLIMLSFGLYIIRELP